MFKLGFVIGRFQHIHSTHEKMIRTALQVCDRVILMVGSSQESGTVRNPFNLYTRMNLIRQVFEYEIEEGKLLLAHTDDMTHEDDHSTAWGDFLLSKIEMWKAHYGVRDEVDCFIYGDDEGRESWFEPEKIEKISRVILARKADDLSATSLRELMVLDKRLAWKNGVSSAIWGEYKALRDELLAIEHYCIKAEEANSCQM